MTLLIAARCRYSATSIDGSGVTKGTFRVKVGIRDKKCLAIDAHHHHHQLLIRVGKISYDNLVPSRED